jgi:hypothetical protein
MTNEHSHNQVCGTLNREAIIIFLCTWQELVN